MVITPALALALAIQYSVSISIVLSAFIITVHQCRTKHSIVYVILRLILAETGIAAFIALIYILLKNLSLSIFVIICYSPRYLKKLFLDGKACFRII